MISYKDMSLKPDLRGKLNPLNQTRLRNSPIGVELQKC
jgi:hypothetical protein